jgi:hypothetical protein
VEQLIESQRYTKALPTPEEVARNPELLISDHLAFLLKAHGLIGVSLNMFGPNVASGFAPFEESDDHIAQRRLRIREFLLKINQENKELDFIAIQESWLDESDAAFFEQNGFNALKNGELTLLYKTKGKLTLKENTVVNLRGVFGEVQRVVFTVQEPNKEPRDVMLFNCRAGYSELPYEHEACINQLLQSGDAVIVVGDFNVHIAPTHGNRQNIVTGIACQNFRERKGAGCDWTDGAFTGVVKEDKEGKPFVHAEQVSITLIDPQTGLPADTTIPVLNSEFQKNEAQRLRMCIQIGKSKYTQFEKELQRNLGREDHNVRAEMSIRSAANAFNERGVMIRFMKEDKTVYEKLCKEIKGLEFNLVDGDTGPIPIVTMSVSTFVEVQEWFFRLFNSARNKAQTAPAFCPLSFCSPLFQLQSKLTELEDNGKCVEPCRQVKSELNELVGSSNPLTSMFAKIIMANYYLRFSEYSLEDLEKMKVNERELPAYIIRPTHLSWCIALCRELMGALTPEFVDRLSEQERNFLSNNLSNLCDNFRTVIDLVRDDLAKMYRLLDKVRDIKDEGNLSALHHENAAAALKECVLLEKEFAKLKELPFTPNRGVVFIKKIDRGDLLKPSSGCNLM